MRAGLCFPVFALAAASLVAGCHSIGPATVPRDRHEYSTSITESWKRQTLLNIVKLRYMDPPIFVDVGQIVSGYSLETVLSAGGVIGETDQLGGSSVSIGGSGRFIDRPTITYTPMTGNRFMKGLMTPPRPEAVFYLIESGLPADGVLFAAVSQINGLKNQQTSIEGFAPPDAGFLRVLELFRNIQTSGAMGMRLLPRGAGPEKAIMTFRSKEVAPKLVEEGQELRSLLGLNPEATEFDLVFGSMASHDREIAVQTRSILQIMTVMSSQVDVPSEHVKEGRTLGGWESVPAEAGRPRMIQIRASRERPPDAFVAVEYRDHWFWIDDRDLKSKRSLAFMMLLFTLAETGDREPLPLVTIPAQ